MKRVIFISILSVFVFSLLLAFSITWLQSAQWQLEWINSGTIDEINIETIKENAYVSLRNGLLLLFGSLCTLAIYILIALKEFKVFQPIVDKYTARRNAAKQARDAARQARKEEAKQKEIAELEKKLDELKKD